MAHKVARNIFSLVFSKVLALALVFIGYRFLFNYLGPTRSGQYQFVLAYIMIFSVVVDFGIQQLVIKRVSEDKAQTEKYFGNFFAVEFVLAFFFFALLAVIAILAHYDQLVLEMIIIAGFAMFLNAVSIPYMAILSAYEDMHIIAAMNFTDSFINFSVMLLTVFLHRSILFLTLIPLLMAVVHAIVYYWVIHKYIHRPRLWQYLKNLDFQLVKQMFKLALPFGALIGFSIIYNKIDVIILQHLRGYAETGFYTVAYKFVDFMAFFPGVVSSALYPFVSSQITAHGRESIKTILENYTRYLVSLGVPIAFGGVVLAPKLIVLIGGSQFYPAYPALQILVFASAILMIYAGVNSVMINQLTKLAVAITFSNIFINVIGNLIFVPIYGFKAAAAMTVVSELVQATMYFYFVRSKIVQFHVWRYLPKPLLSAAVMALLLWPLRNHSVVITLPLGIIVYAAMILLTGYYHKGDFANIRNFMNRRKINVNIESI